MKEIESFFIDRTERFQNFEEDIRTKCAGEIKYRNY